MSAACFLGPSVVSCSGSAAGERKPTALLSPSIEAEGEMRALLAAWAGGSQAERARLEPDLVAFHQRHPDDDLTRLADVLVAWIALDRGDLYGAEVQAHALHEASGPGSVADLAVTVEGAALRRQGRAKEALELLDPLVNKLLDPWARALHNPEVVASAVAAGRWARALSLMRIWLREAAPEERATARAAVEGSLAKVPPPALLALLDGRLAGSADTANGGAPSPEDDEMRKLVAGRLASVARGGKDAHLAQHLLSTAGGLLGDQGEGVAQLAAGESRARVEARTVGLVLSLRSDETRRRGAEIAAGVAFGLGLPASGARLVSRDDHGSPDRLGEALAALSADGASILIAGSDEQEATAAAAFAEAHHLPVILLRPPAPVAAPTTSGPAAAPAPAARFSFVVGPDAADLEAALIAALVTRGASPVAVLTDDPARPRAPRPDVTAIRPCAEVASSWKGAAAGVVLSAPVPCAREALAAAAPLHLRFAAGFEPELLALPPGSVVATAGLFPVATTPPPPLAGWLEARPGPPSWWAALGHDAAVLAWAGVQVLPAQGTEDPAEVEARRAQAAAALASAQADLWTTDARGFAGARALPRTVGAREVSRPSGLPPPPGRR